MFPSVNIAISWVHTTQYTGRFVVMRRIITTNRPHHIVCMHYMHAPTFVNKVVWSAMHAAQSHDIIKTLLGHVHTVLCVHTIRDPINFMEHC